MGRNTADVPVASPCLWALPLSGGSDILASRFAPGKPQTIQPEPHDSTNNLVQRWPAGAYLSDKIPLFIEYKPKETRRVTVLPRATDVLLLLHELQVASMGATMDYGHSLCAGEHPAMALAQVANSPFDFYVHINDNDKTWD